MPTLINNLQNVKYLARFSGSNGFLILGKKNYFFTDFRYKDIAKELEKSKTRIKFEFIEIDKNLTENLKKVLRNSKNISFESNNMTVDELSMWKKRLKGFKFTKLENTIEDFRKIKDKEEIEKLKISQKINEDVLEEVKKLLKPGITELEVAWKIKSIGHDMGAQDISFEPIVGFQENSAVPHHQNTDRKLKNNELVLIDMGMKYQEYCSDMTRTFFFGKGSSEQHTIYNLVLESQLAGIKAIKAGVKAQKVDEISRKVMGEFAEHFGHSLGHGIGLDVHEAPSLSSRSKDTLEENMIVTVEPGIYLTGKFGVRIEDMGRVTKTGYENFTKAPK
ncbi:MAG: aminopeptidase P family protein [Patescibacteria group bacterium]